jgi:type IV fimbrial biogenesis protein FimT
VDNQIKPGAKRVRCVLSAQKNGTKTETVRSEVEVNGMATQVGLRMVSRRRLALGFTLVELMVTVAIVAILAAAAAPNIRDMIQRNRVSAYSTELIAALALARSEAIRRGTTTALSSVTSGGSLTLGWQVEAATFKSPDKPLVLQKRNMPLKNTEFSGAIDPNSISFNSRGGLDKVNGAREVRVSLNLIPSNCVSGREVGRTIVINAVGRIGSKAFACP